MLDTSHSSRLYRNISLLIFLFFVYLSIQTAWLSDDCHITLRTVRNFVEGYGLRWNIDERVQVYTHPLWMWLLSAVFFFTREAYFTTILLSLCVSWLAVASLKKLALSNQNLFLGFVACCVSRAFLDYTSSGLENPLSYWLIALFCLYFLQEKNTKQHFFYLCLVGALLIANRMDTGALIFPALVYAFFQQKDSFISRSKNAFLGFLPLIAWLIFATIYYGFPFPNTAYAKLYTGISNKEIFLQGFYYYLESIYQDPITLIFIALTSILCFWEKKWKPLLLILGICLYFAYILKIGGDFMSGRFFSVPYFICVILFIRIDFERIFLQYFSSYTKRISLLVPIIAFFLLGLCCSASKITLFNHYKYAQSEFTFGIADERAFYYDKLGLVNILKQDNTMPQFGIIQPSIDLLKYFPKKVMVGGMMGMPGYFSPKDAHIIDQLALTDALLARMKPPFTQRPMWRIGHLSRFVPHGYIETLETGKNCIKDSAIANLYEALKVITQEDIWSAKRWHTMLDYYKGKYQANMGIVYPKESDYLSPEQLYHASLVYRFNLAAQNKGINPDNLPIREAPQLDKTAYYGEKLVIDSTLSLFFHREPHFESGLYKFTFSLKTQDNSSSDTIAKIATNLGKAYSRKSFPVKELYIKGTDFKEKDRYQHFEIQLPYSFSYQFLLTAEIAALTKEKIDCEYIRCEKIAE